MIWGTGFPRCSLPQAVHSIDSLGEGGSGYLVKDDMTPEKPGSEQSTLVLFLVRKVIGTWGNEYAGKVKNQETALSVWE